MDLRKNLVDETYCVKVGTFSALPEASPGNALLLDSGTPFHLHNAPNLNVL